MLNWTPKDLQERIEAGDKIFLKLWKKGCGGCKLSIPAIERLEAANEHGLVFGQISTDEHPEILDISESEMLPAFFVFMDKTLKAQFVGFKGLESLKTFVNEAVAS